MRRATLFAILILAPVAAGSVSAEEMERYRLEKSADGFVRMDTMTGEMSICEERGGQLVCRIAADERAAYQDDIDRLESSVRSMDERITKLENSLAAKLESSLPTEEDFDKTMGYMERFFRGFMGIVKELDTETPKDPTTLAPQKS